MNHAMKNITREVAIKVRDTVDAGLVAGLGEPTPGQMCVEAVVCYAMGLPHGDNPPCVAPSLRNLKIALNDNQWSSPQARAEGLRRLAVAQLGSAGALDELEFHRRVTDMTIRKVVPVALRAAASISGNGAFVGKLEAAAVRCEQEGTREACNHAYATAYAAATAAYATNAAAYAADAAAYAADDADYDAYAAAYAAYAANAATVTANAANAAAYAADATGNAADAAAAAIADAYAADAAAYAADDAGNAADAAAAIADARTRDRLLRRYAEWVVEILIDMGAPGCQWLDIVPIEGD